MSNERDSDKDESASPLPPPSDPFGQSDPFGPQDPFAPVDPFPQNGPYGLDPFGAPTPDSFPVAVELGFSAPVDYTAETYNYSNTNSDPFGNSSGVDPFANPTDPFANTPSVDPFASAVDPFANSDPFATGPRVDPFATAPAVDPLAPPVDPFATPSSPLPTTVHRSQLDTFGSILEAQYGPSIHQAITELALDWLGSPVSLQFRLARLASREELSFVLLLPGMRAVRQRFLALKADLATENMRPAFESVKLLWEGVKNQAALEPTFADLSLANPAIHQAAMNILEPCERLVLENCPAKAPHGLLRKYRLIYFGIVADQYS